MRVGHKLAQRLSKPAVRQREWECGPSACLPCQKMRVDYETISRAGCATHGLARSTVGLPVCNGCMGVQISRKAPKFCWKVLCGYKFPARCMFHLECRCVGFSYTRQTSSTRHRARGSDVTRTPLCARSSVVELSTFNRKTGVRFPASAPHLQVRKLSNLWKYHPAAHYSDLFDAGEVEVVDGSGFLVSLV